MTKHEIESEWMGKMQVDAIVHTHSIVMDAPPRVGGKENGPTPKLLVMTALSGCTGMDAVALRKLTCTRGILYKNSRRIKLPLADRIKRHTYCILL